MKRSSGRYLVAAIITISMHAALFLIAYVNEFTFINFVFFKKHYNTEFLVETVTEESKAGTGATPVEQESNPTDDNKPQENTGTSIRDTEVVKGITDSLPQTDSTSLSEGSTGDEMLADEGNINSNGFGGYGEYGNFGIEGHKPKFQGRDSEYFGKWFRENFTFPKTIKTSYNERVKISFVIDRRGDVRNLIVYGCSNKLVEDEIIKTVSTSPEWTPAEVKGIPRDFSFEMYIIINQ
jgi:hypothetical protein